MRNFIAILAIALLATTQVSRADETPVAPAAAPAATPAIQEVEQPQFPRDMFVDVRIVDTWKYFEAKQKQLPIREQDTIELLKQYGEALQLALERWSVDHPLPGWQEAERKGLISTNYPTYDKLDGELNDYSFRNGSYTGKQRWHKGKGFYANPVTASSERDWNGIPVPLGWSANAPGNFTYVYQLDDNGHVIRYHLYFYGPNQNFGPDVNSDGVSDGVVLELATGTDEELIPANRPWYCNGAEVKLP